MAIEVKSFRSEKRVVSREIVGWNGVMEEIIATQPRREAQIWRGRSGNVFVRTNTGGLILVGTENE